jgi:regulator of cell morphogenesis and NO signaling
MRMPKPGLQPQCTIADVALDFPQSIKILQRHGLEYCCHGNVPFSQGCRQRNLDPEEIWNEIQSELPLPDGNHNFRFDMWDIPQLLDHIQQNHHEYIRIAIPKLSDLIDRVALNHADEYPELRDIKQNFDILSEELLDHLPKEEEVLFPAIRRLIARPLSASVSPLIANIHGPVSVLESEHNNAGEILRLLRSLTNHYSAPAHVCPTFHSMYRLLEEFDNDLVQHIHLENNIVFEKVKSLSFK